MKTNAIRNIIVVILLLIRGQLGYSQGTLTFVNLGFENPIPPLIRDQYFSVPITNALPGWTGYIGGSQITRVSYNALSLGSADICLLGPGSGYQPFQGSYFVVLEPSFGGSIIPALGQNGTIPATAQSLTFYASGALQLSFAGQPVPLYALGSTSTYTVYGGSVSEFAGQTGELLFQGGGFLDNIQFSSFPIPEPSTYAVLVLGLLAFGWRCFPKRR